MKLYASEQTKSFTISRVKSIKLIEFSWTRCAMLKSILKLERDIRRDPFSKLFPILFFIQKESSTVKHSLFRSFLIRCPAGAFYPQEKYFRRFQSYLTHLKAEKRMKSFFGFCMNFFFLYPKASEERWHLKYKG